MQRIRITYGVDGALVYASVLDMGRLWERLLRRAGVPLVYSQGFNPHPRLQFASPLPVGYSSECEVLDIWLAEQQDMAFAQRLMAAQAPKGLLVTRVEEVALDAPVLQAEVRRARYRVRLCTPMSGADLQVAFDRLLSTTTLPRQRMKKGRMATYDLRPLVDQLVLASDEGGCYSIEMLLCAGAPGSGRPEEVIDALSVDVQDLAIRRTALLWGNGREDRP